MGGRWILGLPVQATERKTKAPPRTRKFLAGRPNSDLGIRSKCSLCRLLIVSIFVVISMSPNLVRASDGCNWSGSGLDDIAGSSRSSSGSSRVVRPLYLRCSQGRIKWSYPRGALRLLLKLSRHSGTTFSSPSITITSDDLLSNEVVNRAQSSGRREFKGCIRVEPDFAGARIYLEGHRRLHLLHAGRVDPRPLELVRCFVSVRGRAALYVEAEPGLEGLKGKNASAWTLKKMAAFQYDLQPLGQETYKDDFEECRPCSEEEMLQNYCTSDFVVKGTINALYHNEAFDRTELTIRASRVFRDSESNVFIKTMSDLGQTTANSASETTEESARYGVLHRPIKCGTKVGHGDFLFMGHIILGNPKITCAPRLGDWKKIRRKAILDGLNQCGLD